MVLQVELKFISENVEVLIAEKNVTIVENSIAMSVTDFTLSSTSLFTYHL